MTPRPAAPCRRSGAAASDGADARPAPPAGSPPGWRPAAAGESVRENARRERFRRDREGDRDRDPQATSTSWFGCMYWCVPSVTTGLTVKFSVGGGDGISHSSPRAPHGSLTDFSPATSEYAK